MAMTAAMLNGGPGTSAPDACGAMTSGGTDTRAHSCRRTARTHTGAVQCAEFSTLASLCAPLLAATLHPWLMKHAVCWPLPAALC